MIRDKDYNRFADGMIDFLEDVEKHPYNGARSPFRIAGKLHYVGNAYMCSHLIDTGAGLILIDTPCIQELYLLVQSMWELGFNPKDIKYIVLTHGHHDHFASAVPLVKMSGAKVFLGAEDAEFFVAHPELVTLGSGKHGYVELPVPDVLMRDGDLIKLGDTEIRVVATPGHTPGSMSFFFDVIDQGRTLKVGTFGGAGFVTLRRDLLRKNGLPLSMRQVFRDSIDRVLDEKVDIMLGNHPFHNDTFEKYELMKSGKAQGNPFIDKDEWRRFLLDMRERFDKFVVKDDSGATEVY